MITTEEIREILEQYQRFDWVLRRILLTNKLKVHLKDDLEKLFGDAQITSSDIDAAWFSRPGKNNREAWELRIFSENPFALLETFGDEQDEAEREKILDNVQTRMAEVSSKKSAN